MIDTSLVLNLIIFTFLAVVVLRYVIKYAEQTYAENYKKPFFRSFIFIKKQLNTSQLKILEQQFSFYKKLNENEKKLFCHRMACFIEDKTFIGRENLVVTDEMKVLISATAIMMTFGFRKYLLSVIQAILIYPESFYSKQNDSLHKGEVNPKMKVMVLSWKDFKHGFDIENDNLNLGIHEFGHAIHFNASKNKDISSQIFDDGFLELKQYLKLNEDERKKLVTTKYFRAYAYTNEYEFVAVILECFFETPQEFKNNFPSIYLKVKQMLNFHFIDY